VNPGGPGQSGIEFVEQAASFVFPPEVLKKFDIIGWDPRGAGKSSKVECLDDMDVLFDGIDYSPDSQEEFDKMVQVNQELGQRCDEKDAELTRAITTENSVKDMDTIRVALKEEKLNFLGFSYGSALGQIYAADYPRQFSNHGHRWRD
jgi:pimeloyl-ACP methyl ester carboxylesterase